MLIAVCVLSPTQLEHVLSFTSFRLRFGGILRGRFAPRTWFDCLPAGTVLAGTRLFRTRSDYKKWCVPRTCSWNMFQLELYREQVWTPGRCIRQNWEYTKLQQTSVLHRRVLTIVTSWLLTRLYSLWVIALPITIPPPPPPPKCMWRVSSQNGLRAIFYIFKVSAPSYDTKICISNDTQLIF